MQMNVDKKQSMLDLSVQFTRILFRTVTFIFFWKESDSKRL